MPATFIRPTPAIELQNDVIQAKQTSVNEVLPELLREADVLRSPINLPVVAGTNYGYWLGMPQDAFCINADLYATVFSEGMVEIRPSGGINPPDIAAWTGQKHTEDYEPIIHLPQEGETAIFIADSLDRTMRVIAGLITIRAESDLYLPHPIFLVNIEQ